MVVLWVETDKIVPTLVVLQNTELYRDVVIGENSVMG